MALRRSILAGLLLATPVLRAIVYDTQPGIPAEQVLERLGAQQMRRDPITVNGAHGTLGIAWSDLAPGALLDSIAGLLRNYQGAQGRGQVLIEIPGQNGWLTRVYILRAGPDKRSLIFTLHIPRAAQEADAAEFWPQELPRPPTGVPQDVIQLGNGGILWATYTTDTDPTLAARDYGRQLLAAGPWRAVSEDPTGGFYLDEGGRRVLLFSATPGRRNTLAAIFVRPLPKNKNLR